MGLVRRLTAMCAILVAVVGIVGAFNEALAQPTVTATVDRNPAIEGEGVTLKITVRGGSGGRPRAPEELTESFSVQSQGTSRQMTIVNGRSETSLSHEYVLVPKRAGSLTVPSFVVSVGDAMLKTEPIALEVKPRASTTADGGVGDIFLIASVDRERVVAGEEVLLTLSFGYGRQLVDRPQFDPPTFNGFVNHRLADTPFETEIINGARYTVQRIRYALFPLGRGDKTVTEATVTASVPRRQRRDRFGSVFGNLFDGRPVTVKSEPVTITVDPLPPTDDRSFTGAIGRFRLKADIDVSTLKQNDAVTLDIEISGVGNIGSPTGNAPPDLPEFRVFDASAETETPVVGDHLGAVRRVQRVFVPLEAGELVIPEVRFTYFDTATRTYKTLSEGPFPIQVEAVEGGRGPRAIPLPDAVEARDELRFIHTGAPRVGRVGGGLLPVAVGHAVSACALAIGWWWRRRRDRDERDVVGRRMRGAAAKARRGLDEGVDPWRALAGYVADRVNGGTDSPTGSEAADWLRDHGTDELIVSDVVDFSARCDAEKFAPGADGTSAALRDDARSLIERLEPLEFSTRVPARVGSGT